MPRLLTLYIIRHVLGITAVVALAMLAIQSFITLVTDADETGKNGFGVLQLMQTTLLQMPSGLALLMPIVSMIGALMGLGMLAGQSELTAMRAAGLSNLRIALSTLLAGALLGGIGWVVSDQIAPQGGGTDKTDASGAFAIEPDQIGRVGAVAQDGIAEQEGSPGIKDPGFDFPRCDRGVHEPDIPPLGYHVDDVGIHG